MTAVGVRRRCEIRARPSTVFVPEARARATHSTENDGTTGHSKHRELAHTHGPSPGVAVQERQQPSSHASARAMTGVWCGGVVARRRHEPWLHNTARQPHGWRAPPARGRDGRTGPAAAAPDTLQSPVVPILPSSSSASPTPLASARSHRMWHHRQVEVPAGAHFCTAP